MSATIDTVPQGSTRVLQEGYRVVQGGLEARFTRVVQGSHKATRLCAMRQVHKGFTLSFTRKGSTTKVPQGFRTCSTRVPQVSTACCGVKQHVVRQEITLLMGGTASKTENKCFEHTFIV